MRSLIHIIALLALLLALAVPTLAFADKGGVPNEHSAAAHDVKPQQLAGQADGVFERLNDSRIEAVLEPLVRDDTLLDAAPEGSTTISGSDELLHSLGYTVNQIYKSLDWSAALDPANTRAGSEVLYDTGTVTITVVLAP